MFRKKQGKPEIGEVVICTVNKILYHSVFVNLDEYEKLDGMVHISEVSPGRIRNLRDFVSEGRRIVCKVLNINHQGNIDLSLRRVSTNVRINKMQEWKQEEKAEKLLELIGKEVNMDLNQIYDNIGNRILEKYGTIFEFFQAIVENGKKIVDELNPDPKLGEVLFKTVKEKIKPIEVEVSGFLNLRSYEEKGIESVKSILLKAKDYDVVVSYLGAPKYKLEVLAKDYKTAEKNLNEFLEEANKLAKTSHCEINFIKDDKPDS
ncbi:translation initiation factor IF-2 subunit alpha [Candidatus Woesearchaeota archaeon]|nr:translation initiation factor IF-2 subunit alpha [Candidatus Woesearchaeota archaeon]